MNFNISALKAAGFGFAGYTAAKDAIEFAEQAANQQVLNDYPEIGSLVAIFAVAPQAGRFGGNKATTGAMIWGFGRGLQSVLSRANIRAPFTIIS